MPLSSMSVSNSDSATAPKKRGTLLIVDDEEGPRQSLRVVFKGEYDLLLASDGVEALDLIQRHKINAAIIDIRMSGMSGIDVLGQIKTLQPTIQVIMLTAYETIDTMRQALRFGACEYLNKPFDIATIRKAVALAMERSSMAGEMQDNNEKLSALQVELKKQVLQEEVTRSRGEIYASVIHDINGPLTVISGFISLIDLQLDPKEEMSAQDMSEIKDRLKVITSQVNNCVEISHRYLSFMRQRANELPRVKTNQILSDLRHLLKAHPSRKTHQLNIQLLPEDVELQVNGTDLIQILLNLCGNALQCAETVLIVDVTARMAPASPDTTPIQDGPNDRVLNPEILNGDGRLLEISVSDNGPGISPEVLSKLFQTYITTKSSGKGTGLGLSIVMRLLNESKGALHVYSKLGEGTCFSIYLPVCTLKPTLK